MNLVNRALWQMPFLFNGLFIYVTSAFRPFFLFGIVLFKLLAKPQLVLKKSFYILFAYLAFTWVRNGFDFAILRIIVFSLFFGHFVLSKSISPKFVAIANLILLTVQHLLQGFFYSISAYNRERVSDYDFYTGGFIGGNDGLLCFLLFSLSLYFLKRRENLYAIITVSSIFLTNSELSKLLVLAFPLFWTLDNYSKQSAKWIIGLYTIGVFIVLSSFSSLIVEAYQSYQAISDKLVENYLVGKYSRQGAIFYFFQLDTNSLLFGHVGVNSYDFADKNFAVGNFGSFMYFVFEIGLIGFFIVLLYVKDFIRSNSVMALAVCYSLVLNLYTDIIFWFILAYIEKLDND